MDAGEDTPKKGLVIFGRDVSQIPCFRSSFLYGIGGGLTTGLGVFMFTSRPLMSSHATVGGFTLVTIAYWLQCRYRWSKNNIEMRQMKEGLNHMIMSEGTPDVTKHDA